MSHCRCRRASTVIIAMQSRYIGENVACCLILLYLNNLAYPHILCNFLCVCGGFLWGSCEDPNSLHSPVRSCAVTSWYLGAVKVEKLYDNVIWNEFPVLTWWHSLDEKTYISWIFKGYYRIPISVLGGETVSIATSQSTSSPTHSLLSPILVLVSNFVSQGNVEYLLKWKGWPPKWVVSLWYHHHHHIQ